MAKKPAKKPVEVEKPEEEEKAKEEPAVELEGFEEPDEDDVEDVSAGESTEEISETDFE